MGERAETARTPPPSCLKTQTPGFTAINLAFILPSIEYNISYVYHAMAAYFAR